jgi:hypothetical protein
MAMLLELNTDDALCKQRAAKEGPGVDGNWTCGCVLLGMLNGLPAQDNTEKAPWTNPRPRPATESSSHLLVGVRVVRSA